MGFRLAALVLLAVLLAGCASSPDAPRQVPVAEPAPEEPPRDEPPAGQAPDTPPASQPAGPAPVEVDLVHDYRGADEALTFEVPAGSPPVTLRAGFRNPDGLSACSGQEARLVVRSPSGKPLVELQGPTLNLGMTDCSEKSAPELTVTEAGTYKVGFTGQGAILGFVEARST